MSDLWIVPPPSHSAWFSKLDWYLNWQMCKGLVHRGNPPPAEVFRLANEHGLTIDPAPQTIDSPLMIAGDGLIPAKACLVVPYTGDLASWLTLAKLTATDLQASNARVYLPHGSSKGEAAGHWSKLKGQCVAEFTEDE